MQKKKKEWDKRVAVLFQIKTLCDKKVMKDCHECLDISTVVNTFLNPPTNVSGGKILFADVHKT